MKEKLKKLKQFTTASFAIWPFDPRKTTKLLHCRIVIIGLNPAAVIKFGENYHKVGHRFDKWYLEGFSRSPFLGSYMTDLIFCPEPKSGIVIRKWKEKDGKFMRDNIKSLEKQFKILGVKETTSILCIGKNTEKLFLPTFPSFKHVFCIKHPNSYRMVNNKNVFLRDLKEIGKKIQKRGNRDSHD